MLALNCTLKPSVSRLLCGDIEYCRSKVLQSLHDPIKFENFTYSYSSHRYLHSTQKSSLPSYSSEMSPSDLRLSPRIYSVVCHPTPSTLYRKLLEKPSHNTKSRRTRFFHSVLSKLVHKVWDLEGCAHSMSEESVDLSTGSQSESVGEDCISWCFKYEIMVGVSRKSEQRR
jgi:hypothetical protein